MQRANALNYLQHESNYKYVYECDVDYILKATNKNITFLITNSFPVANVKNDNIMRYSYNDSGVTCEINGVECQGVRVLYKVSSYYDLNQMGVEDSAEFNDFTKAVEWCHDKLQHSIVMMQNTETGATAIYTPNYYAEHFEGDANIFFNNLYTD